VAAERTSAASGSTLSFIGILGAVESLGCG
jgi:hypothetical protein